MDMQPTVIVVEDGNDVPASAAGVVAVLRVAVKRFSCPREALEYSKPDMLGCFVLEQQIRETGGLELRRKLSEQGCSQPFIFISRYGDVAAAVEAMHQGALDCIARPFDRKRLLDGVQLAIAKDAAARRLSAERAQVAARARMLTRREMQVLDLVAAGKMTKEIARDLIISPKTVEVHRSNIKKKMRVGSAAELLHLVATHAGIFFSGASPTRVPAPMLQLETAPMAPEFSAAHV